MFGRSKEKRFALHWRRLQDAPALLRPSNVPRTTRYLQVVLHEAAGDKLTPAQQSMLEGEARRVWHARQAEAARTTHPRAHPPPRRWSPNRATAAANRLVREAALEVARNRAAKETQRRELANLERRRRAL